MTRGEASANLVASSSSISASTSMRSRTFPFTWTTIVTRSTCANAGSATGQALRVDPRTFAVPALPGLGRHVRCHRRKHEQDRVDSFVPLGSVQGRESTGVPLETVGEFHTCGDCGVEAPPLEVVCHLRDEPVRRTSQLEARPRRARRTLLGGLARVTPGF